MWLAWPDSIKCATGIPVELPQAYFPRFWTSQERAYLPELELACKELSTLGIPTQILSKDAAVRSDEPVYWYGRMEGTTIWPKQGRCLDNKMNLVTFSRLWKGEFIKVPESYEYQTTAWDMLPIPVVLKASDKAGATAQRLAMNRGVVFRRQPSPMPFLRKSYNKGEVIAQELIPAFQLESNRPTQLIILAAGSIPVSGYLQIALPNEQIINDNSIHGPLMFEGS